MRELTELIDQQRSGWLTVKQWLDKAINDYEVLPRNPAQARSDLHQLQMTTFSPLGAISYETGGILVDSGWLRILGSGHTRLPRTLASWTQLVTASTFQALLIADDVSGGFFALNGGSLVKTSAGYIISRRILSNGRASKPTIQVFCTGRFVGIWIYSTKAYAGQVGEKKRLQ
jgi:hypothetical protein